MTLRRLPSTFAFVLLAAVTASLAVAQEPAAPVPAAPAAPAAPPPPAEPPPPGTEVYLLAVKAGEGGPTFGPPQNVSQRPGYDNQPAFLADGSALLYTAIVDGQADIYLYTLADGSRRPLVRTPESEYSPTLIPGDAAAISVVRVEADQKQRLWRIPLSGAPPELLLADAEPVGYHAWSADGRQLALFLLGEPPTLEVAPAAGGPRRLLARDIGRALHRLPGRGILFVHKLGAEEWWLTATDLETGKLRRLVRTRPGREDFTVTASGEVWMADGTVLYRWRPGDTTWQRMTDLATSGLRDVTRLATSPDGRWLAVVAAE